MIFSESSRQKETTAGVRDTGCGFSQADLACVCQKSPGVSIKPLFLSSRWWYIARLRFLMSSIHTLLTYFIYRYSENYIPLNFKAAPTEAYVI